MSSSRFAKAAAYKALILQGRIAMQTVQIAYASPAIVGAKGVGAPLEVASRGFLGNFVGVLAAKERKGG